MLSHRSQIIAYIGLPHTGCGEIGLILRLARELAVRTGPVVTVGEKTIIEPHAGIVGIERQTAVLEGFGTADVPIYQRSAHAELIAWGRIGSLHGEDRRKGLTVFAAVSAQREVDAFEQEG